MTARERGNRAHEQRGDLRRLRVVELGHVVAGPFAGMIFADLGAEVIKIEHPDGGDSVRKASSHGLFVSLNRNKKSAQLDLRSDRHRRAFFNLIADADVFIENLSPGTPEKLGIGYTDLSDLNPRLIYCSIKGFLPGPYGHRRLVDEMAQMMGGLAYMTGPVGTPMRAGASIVDMTAATFAVVGAFAALHRRNETNVGAHVTSGMFETVALWVARYVVESQLDGVIPVPLPAKGMGSRMRWEVYDRFMTADERLVIIACTNDKHWSAFCGALELDHLATDRRFLTKEDRLAARPLLLPAIQEVVGRLPAAEIVRRLDDAGVPVAPVNNPADLVSDTHLHATRRLQRVEDRGRDLWIPVVPFILDELRKPPNGRAPDLGEHTDEILARYDGQRRGES